MILPPLVFPVRAENFAETTFWLDIALPKFTRTYLGCFLHWFALFELSCVSIGLGQRHNISDSDT